MNHYRKPEPNEAQYGAEQGWWFGMGLGWGGPFQLIVPQMFQSEKFKFFGNIKLKDCSHFWKQNIISNFFS